MPDFARVLALLAATTTTTKAAMTTLTVLAAVLQRRFEVAPYGDDYREPLAIWTMTALGSASTFTAGSTFLSATFARYTPSAAT
mgnify:CR=1 FL=1